MNVDQTEPRPAVATNEAGARSPRKDAAGKNPQTLTEAFGFFCRKATPRIIFPVLVLVTVLRIRQGGWSWWDLTLALGILAMEPFTEWAIHVYVLHFRPKRLRGVPIDFHAAKKHREHHQNPHDPDTAFVPLLDLLGLGVIMAGLFWLIVRGDLGLWLTGLMVSYAMLFTYEWTHYLIHMPYKPKGRYYRYIWRAHRLHHFKNEHYWMGVTVHLADHVLGTFPQKSQVENSPTARTLGIEIG